MKTQRKKEKDDLSSDFLCGWGRVNVLEERELERNLQVSKMRGELGIPRKRNERGALETSETVSQELAPIQLLEWEGDRGMDKQTEEGNEV